jgi:hypothetical protein
VQHADVDEETGVGDGVEVGSSMRTSLRLAPSIAQPMGMP